MPVGHRHTDGKWYGLDGALLPSAGGGGVVTPPSGSAPFYDRGSFGTSLGSYSGSVPATAKYVDTVNGNDANAGTLAAPWRTVDKALASAQGLTTVFRGTPGGTEANARWIPYGRVRSQLTSNFTVGAQVLGNGTVLMGAPGEAVGFDGGAVITGPWTQDAATGYWWRSYTPVDWSPQDTTSYFGTATYTTAISSDNWASLDGSDPSGNTSQDIYWQQVDPTSYFGAAAARPERTFYDGVELIHVDKKAKLQAGRFWIDAQTNRQWIANNPAGHVIEFTVQQKLFNFLGYDQGFVNMGVRRYADSMPQGGVLSAHRARFTLDHVWMSHYMAGLTLQGVNNGICAYDSQITNSTFRYGKSIHVRGTKSDRVELSNNFALNGNSGLFNPAPACGAFKFTYLRDTDVNGNKFVNADLAEAPGITGHGKFVWFDAAVWRAKIRNNQFWYCGQRSVVCELNADPTIFNNLDMYPGAESQALVDCGGVVNSANNTTKGAGRLRGQAETVINVGYWSGGIIHTVRDTRQRNYSSAPPSYVYDGRESTAQWPGGNGNEAVAALETYPTLGNTPRSLNIFNNVYCRWDETAVYVDEEQSPTTNGGVSYTGTGRVQDYNLFQPSTSYTVNSGTAGPNAVYGYLDNNTTTAVSATTQAALQGLGFEAHSRFISAAAADIVDANGALVDATQHSFAQVIPENLRVLLPAGTLPAGSRYFGYINTATPTTVAAHTARLTAGTTAAPSSLGILGDSIPFGAAQYGATPPKYLNSWPGKLRTALAGTYGVAGSGVVLFNQDLWPITTGAAGNTGWDPRITVTGTITEPVQGLFGKGAWTIPAGGATPGTYVELAVTCTQFKLYLIAGSGTVRYTIDGGTQQTATPTAAANAQHSTVTIAAGALGLHTLRFWGDTATVTAWAWKASRGDGRVSIDNESISGQALQSFLSATAGRDGGAFLDTLDPDVVLICLGTNDYNAGIALATAQTNLTTVINRVKANGGIPLVMFPPQSNSSLLYPGGSAATYTQYADGFATTCAAANVPYLNLRKLWSSAATEQAIYDAGNLAGKYADTIHPSDAGAADIAAAVQSFLGI